MSFDKMAAPYPRSGEAEMEVPCPWLPRGLLLLTHSVSEGIVKQAGWCDNVSTATLVLSPLKAELALIHLLDGVDSLSSACGDMAGPGLKHYRGGSEDLVFSPPRPCVEKGTIFLG